jgi:hypothetical protein
MKVNFHPSHLQWRNFVNRRSTATNISTTATNNGIAISTTADVNSGLTDSRTYSNSTGLWSNVTGTTWAANTPYALFIRGLASEVTGLTSIQVAPPPSPIV